LFSFWFFRGVVSAFTGPEKLVFDLTWAGIKAGTSTLETVNDKGRTKIISTARSAKWVSLFYTVDDRVESLLRDEQTVSLIACRRITGSSCGRQAQADKELIFDHANSRVTFIDHISNEKKISDRRDDL